MLRDGAGKYLDYSVHQQRMHPHIMRPVTRMIQARGQLCLAFFKMGAHMLKYFCPEIFKLGVVVCACCQRGTQSFLIKNILARMRGKIASGRRYRVKPVNPVRHCAMIICDMLS